MDAKHTNNRIAAAAVALFVSVTVLIGGGIALAGASDAGPASGERTTSASTSTSTSSSASTSTAALDEVTVSEPVEVATSIAPATTEPDCDAFFAELDAQHNANNQAFVEVLDRFDIANELIVDGGYTWVDFNYDDPIADTISQSFWSRLAADEDPELYDHPCFEFEGCEGFDEGLEHDETDDAEYDTAEYEEEPELTDEEWAELDAQWEAEWEQMLAEHNAAVEALAAALAEAGVEHELNVEYDWATLTFDLDDDRAIPVVAALR